MKIRLWFYLVSFCALSLAPWLHAAEAQRYLTAGQPDPVTLLAPPPVPGSAEDAADLETAFRVASAHTADELARAKGEDKLTIFHFTPAIGPWFVAGKFPKTEALFKQVEADIKPVTTAGKTFWKRIRPYHVAPERFPDAIEHEDLTDYSYPSGHSTRGTAYAFLLAELFPAQREAILAKGRDSGWLRVLGGVHYPTDVYAGRVLGQALAREFLRSEKFQADLAAARAELATARR
jgi:acid phosphatase (class A)